MSHKNAPTGTKLGKEEQPRAGGTENINKEGVFSFVLGKKAELITGPRKAIGGTKFRLYVQPPWTGPAWEGKEPELITVSTTNIQPGPEDDRFKVVDAKGKQPYDDRSLPPWDGPQSPPVRPNDQGHFDTYKPGSPEFTCCTMYATVRRVLDVWEGFFGRPIDWHFARHYPKMELIPQLEWNNAQSGWGFIEFGFGTDERGRIDHNRPYCQNFDVLAHELGHSIIFSVVGWPSNDEEAVDYGGFHESAGDLVALMTSLHFDTMLDRLLQSTHGDLFSRNELSRLAELSTSREIRIAFNDETMRTVGNEPHDRSLPLTGAIFDIFVEVFQHILVKNELISKELAARSFNNSQPLWPPEAAEIRNQFSKAYAGHESEFKQALILARDYLGKLLAKAWDKLDPNTLTYSNVALALMDADLSLTRGLFHPVIRSCFEWRKIDIQTRRSVLFRTHKIVRVEEGPYVEKGKLEGKVIPA